MKNHGLGMDIDESFETSTKKMPQIPNNFLVQSAQIGRNIWDIFEKKNLLGVRCQWC